MQPDRIFAITLALTAVLAGAARAANCHDGSETVTVSGTIHMRVLPPDKLRRSTRDRTYPVIRFDQPVCFKDEKSGGVPNGKVAAVLLVGAQQKLTEGQHVSLRGRLSQYIYPKEYPEDLMLIIEDMPADAPALDEVVINPLSDAVAERCAKSADQMTKEPGEKILKVVVTRSPRWGTIWRADISHPLPDGYPPMLSRTICTHSIDIWKPLDMFDLSKSIPRQP